MEARFGLGPGWWSEAEKPQRRIYLDAYYIDETPVTNEEYKRLVDVTGRDVPRGLFGWDKNLRTFPTGKDKHPVVAVTWDDANAYAQWAGGRLPTEAEWEKAARGGIYLDGDQSHLQPNPSPKRFYPWGNEEPDASRCSINERGETPVGKYASSGNSPYGVMDMVGNVHEWCADWYDYKYYEKSPERNPQGPDSGIKRVLRGGSLDYPRPPFRCATRHQEYPYFYPYHFGFRVVVSPI
jgi:formylglycine-generating enzyme required for sulfatase activity